MFPWIMLVVMPIFCDPDWPIWLGSKAQRLCTYATLPFYDPETDPEDDNVVGQDLPQIDPDDQTEPESATLSEANNPEFLNVPPVLPEIKARIPSELDSQNPILTTREEPILHTEFSDIYQYINIFSAADSETRAAFA